jgi:hypothetical protein
MYGSVVSSRGGTAVHKNSTYPGKVESFSASSKPIVSLTDGTETLVISIDFHPDQNVEIDPSISESSVPSTESTEAQVISTHSVQPMEIRLFCVKKGLYASFDLFIDALSSP